MRDSLSSGRTRVSAGHATPEGWGSPSSREGRVGLVVGPVGADRSSRMEVVVVVVVVVVGRSPIVHANGGL